jgi:hypothetical protein
MEQREIELQKARRAGYIIAARARGAGTFKAVAEAAECFPITRTEPRIVCIPCGVEGGNAKQWRVYNGMLQRRTNASYVWENVSTARHARGRSEAFMDLLNNPTVDNQE